MESVRNKKNARMILVGKNTFKKHLEGLKIHGRILLKLACRMGAELIWLRIGSCGGIFLGR